MAPTYPPLLGTPVLNTGLSQGLHACKASRGHLPLLTLHRALQPRARSLHPKPTPPRIRPPPDPPSAPGSAPSSGALRGEAAGRSLCPRRRPARERNGGGEAEVVGGDPVGPSPNPRALRDPQQAVQPCRASAVRRRPGLARAPTRPLHPGPASRGSPWGLRGAGISGSLGSRDR